VLAFVIGKNSDNRIEQFCDSTGLAGVGFSRRKR
jgi:hypothetical protein